MPIPHGLNAATSYGTCSKCGNEGSANDDLRASDSICRGCGGDGDGHPQRKQDMAYTAVLEGPDEGRSVAGFYLALAKRGEAGYHQLKPGYGPYESEAAARNHALEMNIKLGHDERSASDVVTSSIAAQIKGKRGRGRR